ncbi:MAG: putative DNA binding domain-containing protein [Ignavibacteriales bacterium]|nr:putative DNA binding domain-containing protein [Ignavibacteriales bacterium]
MKPEELLDLVSCGETSKVQFKRDVNNAVSISQEMVAFANSKGGLIIIGVEDKTGGISGLSYEDLQRINNLLSTAAQEHVKSPIVITTETVTIGDKRVIVVEVPEGTDKPHFDKDGFIFIKNGADKRKVTSKEEISRLLQSVGNLYAEERIIPHSKISDIDRLIFTEFFEKKYKEEFKETELNRIIPNLRLGEDGKLNVAGALLFGKQSELLLPQFFITAIWFWGNDITETSYRSSENIYGTIGSLYRKGFDFIFSKLNKLQGNQSFNSLGIPEIPEIAISEILINALIHRDYFINDSIKIFVFENRVEIISPGRLPNNLTVDQIKRGIRRTRNNIIASFAPDLVDYRGAGSGILRVSQLHKNVEFINDIDGEQFRVIFHRPVLVR